MPPNLFGQDWAVQLQEYDLSRGRIWLAVLIVVLFAPLWTARLRGLNQDCCDSAGAISASLE